jgi:hypothetical protein
MSGFFRNTICDLLVAGENVFFEEDTPGGQTGGMCQ